MNGTPARGISGILNVDKPPGWTSHDVVAAVRRMARQRKVGHSGTLDPLATGVLLVCLGQATRVSEYLMRSQKTYRGAIHLGVATTTDDAEGEITAEAEVRVTRAQVETAMQDFVGHIQQVPPRYSAIKRDGKRLYDLARRGIHVDVPPRPVDVYRLEITEWAPPVVHVEVRCGPGTYIRALARDLGATLGCGAHLSGLCRLSSGSFKLSEAVRIEQLERAFAAGTGTQFLFPLDTAFAHYPALHLSLEKARQIALGQPVADVQGADVRGVNVRGVDVRGADADTLARAYAPGERFVALVYKDGRGGAWRPRKVFVQPEEIVPLQSTSVQHACADE
jgi:tRNA pseudouridine55 synthase